MDTQRYAIIDSGTVADIISPVKGFALGDCFPATLVARAVPCGEEVVQGWTWNGTEFSAPEMPVTSPDDIAHQRMATIDHQLAALDAASIRPLCAIADGTATNEDHNRLAALRAEAAELRAERAELAATLQQ